MHHQDLNKKILIALVVASSLLGVLLLFLLCFWIYRLKNLKNSNDKNKQSFGIFFFHEITYAFVLSVSAKIFPAINALILFFYFHFSFNFCYALNVKMLAKDFH